MNKIILITGSTDGIGKQTALDLAEQGFEIIIHGRNANKVEMTLNEIGGAFPDSKLHGYTADFQSLKSVSEFADTLVRDFTTIDILFNNAAVFAHKRTLTDDGYELNFQVNHLAHQLLTLKIHKLIQSSKSGRIVNVSSMIHAANIDFDNLQFENNYSGSSAYALSKLCNVLFSNKLAREYNNQSISYLSLHPGVIETKLLNAAFSGGMPLSEGSRVMQYAALAPELQQISGSYIENCRPMRSNPITYDINVQDKLWDISMDIIGAYL